MCVAWCYVPKKEKKRKEKEKTMKKLIIALAAVACAVGVQAASFSWSSGNYSYFADSTGAKVTTADGYSAALNGGAIVLAYLGTSANYSWDDATVLSGTGISGTTGALTTTGLARNQGKVSGKFVFSYDDTEGAVNTVKNGSVFGVMYQDATGALSKLVLIDSDGKTGAEIDTIYTVSGLVNDTSSLDAFTFTTAGTVSAPNNFTAVPEPTSGLMLLLGMAGLALRRGRRS